MPFLGKQPTAGFSTIVKDDLTPDGSTTAFTLSKQVASANDIAVFVGNVRQEPTDAYSVSGTTLTMTAAPSSGVNFYVLHIAGTHESSVIPADDTISTAKIQNDAITGAKIENNPTIAGNLGVSGDLTVDTNTLYVDSTNNFVGIKETSPEVALHIKDGDNSESALYIESDAGGGRKWGFRPGDPIAPSNGFFTIRDETAGANRILIADNGRLALGEFTSSPTARVHCNKYTDYQEHALKVEQSSGTVNFNTRLMEMKVNGVGAEVPYINFYGGSTFLGRIRSNSSSNGLDYTTASDYRLKENVTSITGAIDSVKQLNPISFNFISNPDITTQGFLAHEVQDIVSEAVGGVRDGVDEDDNPIYQDLDAGKLIPLLTAALKEAITKIETLETQVSDLQTRVDTLENPE